MYSKTQFDLFGKEKIPSIFNCKNLKIKKANGVILYYKKNLHKTKVLRRFNFDKQSFIIILFPGLKVFVSRSSKFISFRS